MQARAVFAALQITDRLVVHAERVRELAPGDAALGAQHRDPVVDDLSRHAATLSPGVRPWPRPIPCGPSGASRSVRAAVRPPPRSPVPQRFPDAARTARV